MQMPGRTFSGNGIGGKDYKFSFNGKEDDKSSGWFTQDYGFRNYDYRLGRFFSQDPLFRQYPELTPYQFASNRPIDGIDLDGAEYYSYIYAQTRTGLVLISKVDYTDTKEGFGKLGPGVSVTISGMNGKRTTSFAGMKPMAKTFSQRAYAASKWTYNKVLKDGAMESGNDGAHTGKITKQDVKVGTAMVGLVLSGGSIGLGYVVGATAKALMALSIASDIDDLTSDYEGNTFVSNATAVSPETVDNLKLVITGANIVKSTRDLIIDPTLPKVQQLDAADYTIQALNLGYDECNFMNDWFDIKDKRPIQDNTYINNQLNTKQFYGTGAGGYGGSGGANTTSTPKFK